MSEWWLGLAALDAWLNMLASSLTCLGFASAAGRLVLPGTTTLLNVASAFAVHMGWMTTASKLHPAPQRSLQYVNVAIVFVPSSFES